MKHKTENGLAALTTKERNDWNWLGHEAYPYEQSPQTVGIIHVKDGRPLTEVGKRLLREANAQLAV